MKTVDILGKECVEDEELCKIGDITAETSANRRSKGDSPPYFRLGKKVYYPADTLRDWLAARLKNAKPSAPTLVTGSRSRARRHAPAP